MPEPINLDPRAHDLSGMRFGRLRVVEPTNERSSRGHVVWLCECDCGSTYRAPSSELKRRRRRPQNKGCGCGRSKRGEDHHNWKGGRATNGDGYMHLHREVFTEEDAALLAPMFTSSRGSEYVLEHRAVVALDLGRPLESYEHVHHKNGVRDDNRIENLELWETAHPYGQRSADAPHCPTCTCGE